MGGAGDTCSQPHTRESFICGRNSFVGIPKPIKETHRNDALIIGIKITQANQLLAMGRAGDTCSQPHPLESFICGRNSFVGIPKPIIETHRNDALIIGIKIIQGNQLLAMGGAGDTCSQPHPRESFIFGRNSFVGIPKPIIGPHRNVALIIGIKKIQGNQLLAMGGAGDTCSQPHPRESFICGRNSFVGIPKPIIGTHRNVRTNYRNKKIQGNQLLAMGGAGDTCSQSHPRESFICGRNSFVGIPKPI
ncbi:unnamed protein product [Macrosiphum euphorbiae]|uniref:Uncharacterized protein n=1 Tax=Macrosiphum euphorbiae TaxID=13131 RepID=A0AAV0Y325_9HEMI|nr:unnamed protein product [Macrosiphum euphorbiae]